MPNDLASTLLGGPRAPLAGTRLASIIEFGRMIHAEMAAILDAARRGTSTKGTTLFCTTFPCHMCARHIIAAGVTRVCFIEPYPKSLAKDLYPRSIKLSKKEKNVAKDAVRFEPFVGVAPRRFNDFFRMSCARKDARGNAIEWLGEYARIAPQFTRPAGKAG